jgi:hypothetical protein
MRLILSRKGFDSSFGGCASPILPDGQMISLPIPDRDSNVCYSDLHTRSLDLGQLVSDLTGERLCGDAGVHLDPDLESSARAREPGWLPTFGQDSIAQRHLELTGVGIGDLFLFFGWFCHVELVGGKYRYCKKAPDVHVLFGWLRIGGILRLGPDPIPDWLQAHPHAVRNGWPFNTVYVAKGEGGGGVFPRFRRRLQLTEAGKTRSIWRLPSDFMPISRPPLTFHASPSRWTQIKDGCQLQSVAKGQEFVLDLDVYPGVRTWAEELVSRL